MNADDLIMYLLTPTAQVALVIGLAEVFKKLGVPARWIPLIDILIGLISGICVYGFMLNYGIANGVVFGLAVGLSACGLFSGIKNIAEAVKDNKKGDEK